VSAAKRGDGARARAPTRRHAVAATLLRLHVVTAPPQIYTQSQP
jgi:hypothetical protein